MNPIRRHLPRLERSYYRGIGATHWTYTIEGRKTGWLSDTFHLRFREILLHTTVRYRSVAPVYCLMHDHMHILLWNWSENSDSYLASRFLRTHTAKALALSCYQKQAYDHVLKEKETERGSFEAVCHYILENPLRAGICRRPEDYPFCGAVIPGYPELEARAEGFWEMFWKSVAHLMGNGHL